MDAPDLTTETTVKPKHSFLKRLRTIAIISTILLIILIGAGVAYTWYIGQSEPNRVTDTVPAAKKQTALKPSVPPPNAKVGVAMQSFASPVQPGDNSSISIQTTPGANCSINVIYDKTKSLDSGLKNKVADEYGLASWSWTVDKTAPLGTWPVTVSCVRGTQSSSFIGNLMIINTPSST